MSETTLIVEDAAGRLLYEIALGPRVLTLGRDRRCGVYLPSPFVSKQHASIEPLSAGAGEAAEGEPAWTLRALGLNGTRINRRRLREEDRHRLRVGDLVEIPGFRLRLADPAGRSASDPRRLEMNRRYSQLTASLHERLLRQVDLRALTAGNLPEEQRKQRIRDALSGVLDQGMDIEAELLEFVLREAVRAALHDRWIDPDRLNDTWHRTANERTLAELVVRCEQLACEMEAGGDEVEARTAVENQFDAAFASLHANISPSLRHFAVRRALQLDLENLIFHLGPLEDLLKLPDLEEIMVIGNDHIFIERSRHGLQETGRTFPREDDLDVVIGRIVNPIGRFVNRSHPIVDARLADGSRVNIVIPPVSIRGPSITIRKFRAQPFTLEDLIDNGTLGEHAAKFLRGAVAARKNILVSGGTGSGKTTLLNCLGSQIPDDERLVVIEDAAELQLPQPNRVVLEAKRPNIEGEGEVSIRDLVRTALRMRPDRIIVGECRGREALDMLQAMNTGHDGSLTTGHANSPVDMISRLEVMVLEAGANLPVTAIHRQIAGALHLIVQIERRGRRRRVSQVSEVVAYDAEEEQIVIEDIFRLVRTEAPGPEDRNRGWSLAFTGYLPTFIEELLERGEVRLEDLFRATGGPAPGLPDRSGRAGRPGAESGP